MSKASIGEARSTGRQILVALVPLGIAIVGFFAFLLAFAAQDPASDAARTIAYGTIPVVLMGIIAFFRTVINIARILSRRGRPPVPHVNPEGLSDNPTPPPPLPEPFKSGVVVRRSAP